MRKSYRAIALSLAYAAGALSASTASAIIINGTGDGAGQGATGAWDGVGTVNGSATGVLVDSTHVLLAAHEVLGASPASLHFAVDGVSYNVQSVTVNPNYTGTDQYDIAVLKLSTPATGVQTWAYNTGSLNEATAGPTTLVGYGIGGDGINGANAALFPFGTKRAATNSIDLITTANTPVTDSFNQHATLPPGVLAFDFDSEATQDAGPLGAGSLGVNEGTLTDGDSGGPMFQFDAANNRFVITGILIDSTDNTDRIGEIGWGTRVSTYAPFLASAIPEPTTLALSALGTLSLLRRKRR